MPRTAEDSREIGVRQLEGLISELTKIKHGVESGVIHYHTGGIIVTTETTEVHQDTFYGTSVTLPSSRTFRIHGDVKFGTEQKD